MNGGVYGAVTPKCNFYDVFLSISSRDNRNSSIRSDFRCFFVVEYLSVSICGVMLHFGIQTHMTVEHSY